MSDIIKGLMVQSWAEMSSRQTAIGDQKYEARNQKAAYKSTCSFRYFCDILLSTFIFYFLYCPHISLLSSLFHEKVSAFPYSHNSFDNYLTYKTLSVNILEPKCFLKLFLNLLTLMCLRNCKFKSSAIVILVSIVKWVALLCFLEIQTYILMMVSFTTMICLKVLQHFIKSCIQLLYIFNTQCPEISLTDPINKKKKRTEMKILICVYQKQSLLDSDTFHNECNSHQSISEIRLSRPPPA